MWKELDASYGNPRQVSDAILIDIEKFKELREGDDRHFVEYVNLVRASYQVLRQVGRPGDMDNNSMLSRIEQKLPYNMKVDWSRHLETTNVENPMLKDLIEWLETEKRTRIRTGAALRSSASGRVHQVAAPSYQRPEWSKCWLCKSNEHWLDQCQKFKTMSHEARMKTIKDGHACFSCLKKAGNGHNYASCKRRRQCPEISNGLQCTSYHHPLLHVPVINTAASAVMGHGDKILPIVTADLIGNHGVEVAGNVLLDSGAEISIIRQDVADELNLTGHDVIVNITKVGSVEEQCHTRMYNLYVRSQTNKSDLLKLKAISLPVISDDVLEINLQELAATFKLGSDSLRRKGGKLDLLIGIDYPNFHTGETRRNGDLVARRTLLGWVVFGKTRDSSITSGKIFHIRRAEPVDTSMFWSTEALGTTVHPCICDSDQLTRQQRLEAIELKNSASKVGHQWQIGYPWRKDPSDLPDNREQVMARLFQNEKRLMKDKELAEGYCGEMTKMVDNGLSRKLSAEEINNYQGPVHYISHHAVHKPDSSSTPLRIVFNSSSTFKGHCLNDYWKKGPDLLNDILGVLLRFRMHPVAFVGDIAKMFHQILIPEGDQHIHRYLWRNLKVDEEPGTYVMKVVSFGDKPSPAIANTALHLTAEENEDQFPEVTHILKKNTYMDDICCSVPEHISLQKLLKDIDLVLQTGGFRIKQWVSNHQRDNEIPIKEKVLGMDWDPIEDRISLSVTNINTNPGSLTKRKVLSELSKVFDPMGLCSPVIIKAKIAFQRLWKQGVDWDELLNQEETAIWMTLLDELSTLHEFKLERCLTPGSVCSRPQLVVFCDASTVAFGSVAYLRWKVDHKYFSRLIMAKSRVAPLKPVLNIVRLELQAAVVAVRLRKLIEEELQLEVCQTIFLTDSQIVKAMIQKEDADFKPFVSVRVGEIQELSKNARWLCIPSKNNMADCLSRGIPWTQLDDTWRYGPAFLELPVNEWPSTEEKHVSDSEEVDSHAVNTMSVNISLSAVINEETFSNFRRLVRVTARVLQICRRQTFENDCLSPEILQEAENLWIMEAQKTLRVKYAKGGFKSLSPFERSGIIRVGGRADRAVMSYETRHPSLLPYDSWISYLIARREHEKNHDGIATTAEKVRRRFWIIKIHTLIKKIKNRCVICRKLSAKTEGQVMSDLPEERLQPFTPPFHHTAVDLFGPYKVKVGRNKVDKHYGVIFTCLNCRAVHLEMATDYSTRGFLAALRRFFAIRGYPAQMRSDRGTQLIGTERELREQIKGWDWQELVDYGAERQMKWIFTTPAAPHMNGVAESLVKSVKSSMKKVIGESVLTPMEFYTMIQEVGNLINERPIGRSVTDPNDWATLCPNDLLLGRASAHVPQGPFRQSKNPRERFLFVQHLVNSFWKRWTRDTFPSLVPRKKWRVEKRDVCVGDLVIVSDSNNVRGKWTLGKILKVFPGKDGHIRNVRVKTPST